MKLTCRQKNVRIGTGRVILKTGVKGLKNGPVLFFTSPVCLKRRSIINFPVKLRRKQA